MDELEPLLVVPEILKTMYGPDKIRQANRLLVLLRASVSNLDEAALAITLRQSLGQGDVLGKLGRRVLEQADRLPRPELPHLDGLRLMTTAAEIRSFATAMENCGADYISEVAVGLKALCQYMHVDEAGEEIPLAIVLTPLVSGEWEVDQIVGQANARPSKAILYAVLRRLMSIGVQVAGPSPGGAYDRHVAELLGHHPYHRFGDILSGIVANVEAETADEDAILEEVVVALRHTAEAA